MTRAEEALDRILAMTEAPWDLQEEADIIRRNLDPLALTKGDAKLILLGPDSYPDLWAKLRERLVELAGGEPAKPPREQYTA
jgi:hypothetical protein